MNIKIRQAKTQDWSDIQRLNNEVFQVDNNHDDDLDLNWPFSKQGIKYYKNLASGKEGYCLLAEQNTKIVGYIALKIKHFGYRKSKYVEIDHMGVSPEYRSKGIGAKLINTGVKWAKSKKANRLWVSAYWQNKKAIKFYKHNGFFETGLELDKKL